MHVAEVIKLAQHLSRCFCCFCCCCSRKVLFLNTDDLGAYEAPNGPSFHNELESRIIHQVGQARVCVCLIGFFNPFFRPGSSYWQPREQACVRKK